MNQFVDMLYTEKVEAMNNSHYQTLISFLPNLGLYNYPMGGQLHLSQSPTIDIFCVPKQTNLKSWGGGGLIGIGIDRDMKNWEFSKTVK